MTHDIPYYNMMPYNIVDITTQRIVPRLRGYGCLPHSGLGFGSCDSRLSLIR